MKLELTWDRAVYWMIRDRTPVTRMLMILACLGFVGYQVPAVARHLSILAFDSGQLLLRPWSLFTYLIVPSDSGLMSFAFSCYWLWYAGGQMEREWGSFGYAFFTVMIAATSAIGLTMAAAIVKTDINLLGLWLPLAALTTAFGLRNPERQVLFCFVFPIKLKYLVVITVAMVAISYLSVPLIIPFALVGCGCAACFVRCGGQHWLSSTKREDDGKIIRVFDRKRPARPVMKEKPDTDGAAQERLKNFFKRSGIDDK